MDLPSENSSALSRVPIARHFPVLESGLMQVENMTWRLRNMWSKNPQEILFFGFFMSWLCHLEAKLVQVKGIKPLKNSSKIQEAKKVGGAQKLLQFLEKPLPLDYFNILHQTVLINS